MGCWDSFCCFCSGPFHNARDRWYNFLIDGTRAGKWPDDEWYNDPVYGKWPPRDGEWYNDPGYPVPSLPLEEIVTISKDDGKYWDASVGVTANWPDTFVTPLCSDGLYGDVTIPGVKGELYLGAGEVLLIHPACLSFLCRHTSITPRKLWESLHSCSQMYPGTHNGLLTCVNYYDMQGRCEQEFEYALERRWPPLERPDLSQSTWLDPKSMEDTKWLLARPTRLPTPTTLQPSPVKSSVVKRRKVFDTNELIDIILSYIVDIPSEVLKNELQQDKRQRNPNESRDPNKNDQGSGPQNIFEAPSAIIAAKTLLSLAQVDRWFYDAIIHKRQNFFLRALRNFGWMLPFTPADWSDNSWAEDIFADTSSLRQSEIDWRHYMLTCVKKTNPNIRNRWRFHKMAIQFARGTNRYRSEEHSDWFWNAGSLGFKPSLDKPEPEVWELYSW